VNDAMACPSCVEKARRERAQGGPAAFARAVTAGIGVAFVGLFAYALIAIILHGWVISIMAIMVGFFIAATMMRVSKGVGGRRYQIAAVLLTYAAVSMAAIPLWIYFGNQPSAQQTERQKLEAEQRQLEQESGMKPQQPTRQPDSTLTMGQWLWRATLLGLASPFLRLQAGPQGAIGLIILFVGMRMAWKIAAGHPFQVYGPFENAQQPVR
jgi:uncharacterized protein (DUF983 family)